MLRRTLALAAVAVLSASPLLGQHPNTREGFWIGFGVGAGSAGVDCPSCTTDRTSGLSGHLSLGGTVSPNVLLGAETNGWVHSESGVTENLGFLSFIATIYPSSEGAFFLKFGLGGMTYSADDGTDRITATAPAGSFGIGYDFRVDNNFSITPFFNSLATSEASFKINGFSVPTSERIKINLVQIGVGVTWH